MRWDEGRHLSVFETPDADSPEPARMNSLCRLGVGRINNVVPIDSQATDTAEIIIFGDELPILRQNLNPVVVTIRDNQPAFRIEFERMRGPEFAGAGTSLA